ncbi:MAG: hypothetical protein K8T25_19490 [Planctomycetia bacterium]|nr:hypothetical protein [Planctomycetia bacterium]
MPNTPSLPYSAALVALAVVGILAWLGVHHWLDRGGRGLRLLASVIGTGIGGVAFWLLLDWVVMERWIVLEGSWGVRLTALIGAAAVEAVLFLYHFEQQSLPTWSRRVIGGLRVALVLLLVLILAEPSFTRHKTEKDERVVAVLVDDSESMDQSDPQATVSEKLELADLFLGNQMPQRFRAKETIAALVEVRRQLLAESEWLAHVVPAHDDAAAAGVLQQRREQAIARLTEVVASIDRCLKVVGRKEAGSSPEVTKALAKSAEALSRQARAAVAEVQQNLSSADTSSLANVAARLGDQLRQAASAAAVASESLSAIVPAADKAYYEQLPKELSKQVDQAAGRTRSAVAKAVLAERPKSTSAILDQLQQKYTVKLYRFAGVPRETAVAQYIAPAVGDAGSQAASKEIRQRTDLTAAVEKATTDIPWRKLAGMIIVSDGRHNSPSPLAPVAQSLSMHSVPTNSVLVGSTAAVVDAALATVTAPRSVQAADRLSVKAEVRVEGLRGQTAEVTLLQAGKTLDQKKIPITQDLFRTEVELADTPQKTGLVGYEVRVAPLSGERTLENNAQKVYVQVTDDPIRLLLVEGRPRWEFRYLRNLFADRDKSVRVQHVLLHPDAIEGAPTAAIVHASASRGAGESSATALPEKEDDWLQFDTIILGDVSPDELGPGAVEALKKFVGRRGGRLIVIAGQDYMPHAYAKSPLQEMLPVICEPSNGAATRPAEPGYFVRLTPEGALSPITQLDANREDNQRLWDSLPEQHVRHAIKDIAPGATVLAFAMPFDTPELFQQISAEPEQAEKLARQRDEYMRSHALLVTRPFGSGQVLMLNFDGTWRFRYQKGDTYHHRFWSQVMRWATVGKLPVGTEKVRLGTDRPVYEPGESVVVKARLRDNQRSAVVTKGATAVVHAGERVVMRKALAGAADAPGMYEADLGALPPGQEYRVSLELNDAGQADLSEEVRKVSTQVMVVPPRSLEATDLSADRTSLELLASPTGGVVVTPAEAAKVLANLGPATREVTEEQRYPLWHSWPLLVALLGVVSTEWILRKMGGLT